MLLIKDRGFEIFGIYIRNKIMGLTIIIRKDKIKIDMITIQLEGSNEGQEH